MKYDKNLYVMEQNKTHDICVCINHFVTDFFQSDAFLSAIEYRNMHRMIANLYENIGDYMCENAIYFTDAKYHFNLGENEIIMLITQLVTHINNDGEMWDGIEYYYITNELELEKCDMNFFAEYGIYVDINDF